MTDTLYGLISRACMQHADQVAVRDSHDRSTAVSYRQLLSDIDSWAAGLEVLGLERGDSIALWLPNCTEWLVTFFAAAKLGVSVVPLNTRYKTEEIRHLLDVAAPKAVVVAPRFRHLDFGRTLLEVVRSNSELGHQPLPPNVDFVITVGEHDLDQLEVGRTVETVRWSDLLSGSDSAVADCAGEDDFAIAFGTSGTTSAPKLAMQTHGAVSRHVAAVAERNPFSPDDVFLSLLPLCGTFGFVPSLATLAAGGTVVLLAVYDTQHAVDTIEKYRVTSFATLESIVRGIFSHPSFTADSAASLERIAVAGVSILDLVVHADQAYGISISNVYGSSEVFAYAATWPADMPAPQRAVPGGVIVSDDLRVRTVDPSTGQALPHGTAGELQFSGKNVAIGYLANPAASENGFTPDGWYRTGDYGVVLDGGKGFRYESRIADTLRLKGTLVDPADIETFLLSRPGVAQVQVVGVPGGDGDDRAVAFVIAQSGVALDASSLLNECARELASFKVPTAIEIVDEYPTTPSANGDKVRKDRLRASASDLIATSVIPPIHTS